MLHNEDLIVRSADTSGIFKLDSIDKYYFQIKKIENKPKIDSSDPGSPRIEIYYKHIMIVDSYNWDESFWDIARPIMYQLPDGFNPFRSDEMPFENR